MVEETVRTPIKLRVAPVAARMILIIAPIKLISAN
jgi:hypothetical protein